MAEPHSSSERPAVADAVRATPAARRDHPGFEPALDGLRGIAALVVVFRHVFNRMGMSPEQRLAIVQSPLALFLNAQGAVQLFFVLSGCVLAASLDRSREGVPWIQFYVKRVFRIHPPYMAAVVVAIAATLALAAADNLPATRTARGWPGAATFAAYMAFPSTAGGFLYPGWTLTIEMIFSFLLPAMALAATALRGIPLLCASALAAFLFENQIALYALDFALGVVAYQQREAIAASLRRLPAALQIGTVCVGALLLSAPLAFWPRLSGNRIASGFTPLDVTLMGLGAAVLVATAVHVPAFRRVLSRPLCLFLGRISYSLFLLHATVLLFFDDFARSTPLDSAALLIGGTGLSIAVSVPFQRFVELPSIALGNRVRGWIASRLELRP